MVFKMVVGAWITVTVILVLAVHVESRPTFVPAEACGVWLPKHYIFLPQKSQAPFVINVSSSSIQPGESLNVTISAPDDVKFKGFLVIAQAGQDAIGTFIPGEDNKVMTCKPGSENVAHHKGSYDKESVTITWKAPKDFDGRVVFRATIVQEFITYWEKVLSPEIIVQVHHSKRLPPAILKAFLKFLGSNSMSLSEFIPSENHTFHKTPRFSLKIPIIESNFSRTKRETLFPDSLPEESSSPYAIIYPGLSEKHPNGYQRDSDEKFELTKGFRDPYVSITTLFPNSKKTIVKRQPPSNSQGELGLLPHQQSSPYDKYPYPPYTNNRIPPNYYQQNFSPYGYYPYYNPYGFRPAFNPFPFPYGQFNPYGPPPNPYGPPNAYGQPHFQGQPNPYQQPQQYNPLPNFQNYPSRPVETPNKLVGHGQYPAFPYGPYPIPQKPFDSGYDHLSSPNYPGDRDSPSKYPQSPLYFPEASKDVLDRKIIKIPSGVAK